MNSDSRPRPSRRTFLANAASSGLLVALGQAVPAGAEAASPGAPNPTSPLPQNFANPEGSPIHALLKDIPLPRMVAIETTFGRPVLADVAQTFLDKLRAS